MTSQSPIKLGGVHHAAYRCKDALETARWYEKYLGMKLILSIAEDQVPSTKEPDPYMHIFLDAAGPSHSNDMHFLKIFRKVVHVQ